ncbi:XRE family transcriptional regulator [Xanthomonas campestris pv. raphani]|uniref:XRE family transcriptional regulator n=1 Tax=Xanthomonas campestris TaxID=339 RepID=UPI001E4F1FE4|nr:XRE family transcriptional regulator [Xanthomonas campestris]MCC8686358.1 XRE family transcriptional regulator [Xanthomonas campestris]MCW2000055.1 Zn-dependent peptidase ImmA (M78 family)/DNA-binding XRE family transcriptional regulator [Xanthomonas campestris]MEA9680615.1 XRE family transcriptional regulator [Xanthomonas campestris pv. raphani]MEA9699058.1 XRE family transcriptional regulator [Xanthomonas campestris pv. raphani]MEA9759915.1 XRE family transcriptional regulator [Xanthomona
MIFNPSRLAIARKRRMLTKKAFAEAIGVTQHTVTRWDRGSTDAPTAENLRAMSQALGFPEKFFFGNDVESPERASFRSQTSMTAAARDAALAAGSVAYLIADWFDARFSFPVVSVPDLSDYPEAEEAARALRERWGLGERPISNIIHLLESKGVRVFSLAENTTKVDAYSLWRNSRPHVFLNGLKTAERSRFDAAHELGHLVLHQDGHEEGREAEDQANRFASAFLMPRGDVLAHCSAGVGLRDIIRLKIRWRVSTAALAYRLHKMKMLSDWKYRDICIELNRSYRRSEPNPIEREFSAIWERTLRIMWSEKVTPTKIAADIGIPEAELRDLIFPMAPRHTDAQDSAPLRSI